jgi:rhamnogalacturonyl hydrolase YesR
MKQLLVFTLCVGFAIGARAQSGLAATDSQLHLMKPDFKGLSYGIPSRDSVKAKMDCVLSFLESEMPIEVVNGRLKQGGLRLTSYEAGVLYAAAQDAARRTGDERYQRFVEGRLLSMARLAPTMRDSLLRNKNYDRQMRPLVIPHSLDDAGAMCAAYCRLAIRHPQKAYDGVIKGYMSRLWKQYRIGDDRIYARTWPHYNTVWLDDMFMGVPALAWYGALKNDTASIADAVRQIRAFKSRMWVQLPAVGGIEQGLFRHGWVEDMNPHPFFPWGRANGWAILTICEVLDAMQLAGYADGREEILVLLRQHVAALSAVQDKSGLWHQLLNDPSSFLETSASAIFTYCLAHAICEGWIDPIAYGAQTLLAWNALSKQIDRQGQVLGTVVGSGMGFDRAFYCYRPVHPMAAHGYGPVIWAGSEIIRMLQQTHPKINDSAVHFYPTIQTSNQPVFSEQR